MSSESLALSPVSCTASSPAWKGRQDGIPASYHMAVSGVSAAFERLLLRTSGRRVSKFLSDVRLLESLKLSRFGYSNSNLNWRLL